MEPHESAASKRSGRIDESRGKTCGWSLPGSEASFTMPASLVNRLNSHVISGFLLLPKRGAEVGGVLLGRVVNDDPLTVHIADFAPVPCEYRFGPTFILSGKDLAGLERVIAGLAARRGVSIVGYFRSCTGRELALDEADGELMRTYFPGPAMIVLSIKPLTLGECVAWFFFRRNGALPTVPTHPALPFDDKQIVDVPQPATVHAPIDAHIDAPIDAHVDVPVGAPVETPVEAPVALSLIPTHEDVPVEKPAVEEAPAQHSWRPWHWLALTIMLLIATVAGFRYGSSTRPVQPPAASPSVEAVKRDAPPAASPTPPPAKPLQAVVPAAVIQQTEPDIPPGIRARIERTITVNVEVRIDPSGKVISAAAKRDGDGLYRFLAERAIVAAQSSKFRPARAGDGTPVPSTTVLSFVFEPSPR